MESKKERLLYIDNLRMLTIVFVVMMHLAVTYSGFGSWYFKEGRPIGIVSTVLFGFCHTFTQGYFMGLMFLLAGFFIPEAYERKGYGKFIKDRLFRLGIPALSYMLIINPFIHYVLLDLNWIRPKPDFISFYFGYIKSFWFVGGSGPLWFNIALLLFTLIYGFVRSALQKRPDKRIKEVKVGFRELILLILLIAVCTFLTRLVQPIGTSIVNMQICYFPQYIILFIAGIYAYKYSFFSKISFSSGIRWLLTAVLLGFISWSSIMILGGALDGNYAFNGGFSWQAAAYAIWESFVGVAVSFGLIALFREKFNRKNTFVKALCDNSFAVYVFHPVVIIFASILAKPIMLPPIIKFVLLSLICIPACFAFTHFIVRKIPMLKRIF